MAFDWNLDHQNLEVRETVPDECNVEGREMIPGKSGGEDQKYCVDTSGTLGIDLARERCQVFDAVEAEGIQLVR